MWPDQRLCDLLGVEHPIIQAPMTGSCTPALASAIANSGGMGSLGCALKSPDTVRSEVADLRRRTNFGFNLNFFATDAPKTDDTALARTREALSPWYARYGLGAPPSELPELPPGFDDTTLDLVLELAPAVVSFHFGTPRPHAVEALKAAGVILLSSATTVNEARALEAAGMDAIIAQGWEAGGHRGSHTITGPMDGVGSLALIPQIADAVSLPVIAAGGIADGRGIAAAFALGASGVQMGTAFLNCPEAATDEPRRERLRKATDTDTIVTDAVSGRAARAMRSAYAEDMARFDGERPGFRQMSVLAGPILDAADDDSASFLLYGQAAAMTTELPAAELMEHLISDARAVFRKLS